MPRYSRQKLKSLYLARILLKTPIINAMSTTDLINTMSAYYIPVERKSIYEDIEALRHYRMDIELHILIIV
jgi:hypothetical protein